MLATSCAHTNFSDNDDSAMIAKDPDTYHTGMRYLTGKGVPQNNRTAAYWLKKSADDDNPYAQSELGYMYTAGKGVAQDYNKAIYWYKKAANQGLASAQYNLGLMYANGIGTPVNKELAHKLFSQAAQRGFEPASRALQSH